MRKPVALQCARQDGVIHHRLSERSQRQIVSPPARLLEHLLRLMVQRQLVEPVETVRLTHPASIYIYIGEHIPAKRVQSNRAVQPPAARLPLVAGPVSGGAGQ